MVTPVTWIGLGVLSALLLGIYDIFRKASLKENAVLPVLLASTTAAALPFAGLLVAGRIPSVDGATQGLIVIKSMIVATSWVLEFFALKHLPISTAAPIRASQPLFTLVGAVVLFGERLSHLRWAGVVLMLGSYLAFSVAGRSGKGRWRGERWVLCAFAASLVGAVSSMYDKYLFNRLHLDALAVQAWYTIYMALFFALIVAVLWWPRRHGTTPFRWRWTIPCIGLALAASDTCYFVALRDPDALIALLTTIRRANVVVAFAAGALLFREADVKGKVLPLAGILAGLVLLAAQG